MGLILEGTLIERNSRGERDKGRIIPSSQVEEVSRL